MVIMTDWTVFKERSLFSVCVGSLLAVGVSLWLLCSPATAASVSGTPRQASLLAQFDIPSQELEPAIVAYCRQSGRQVLYNAELAHGRISSPVQGMMSASYALEALLSGTGLLMRSVDENSFVLDTANGAHTAASHAIEGTLYYLDTVRVAAPALDLQAYSAVIRADLQRTLRRNRRLATGNFVVFANIWIDPEGKIARAGLLRSTGSSVRDTAIIETLEETMVSRPPPAGLAFPAMISIDIKRP